MPSIARRASTAVLIVGLVAGLDGCLQGGDRQPVAGVVDADGTGTVVSITDGDTLRLDVDGRELRVRLTGIDTPEVYPDVECYGPEATDALAALAPVGSVLTFEYDVDPRDRFDRELMYLYAPDGVFINTALVEQGFARAVLFEPNDRHFDDLSALEQRARDAGLGLWGAC